MVMVWSGGMRGAFGDRDAPLFPLASAAAPFRLRMLSAVLRMTPPATLPFRRLPTVQLTEALRLAAVALVPMPRHEDPSTTLSQAQPWWKSARFLRRSR